MTFDRGIFDLQPRLEKLGCRSKIPRSNVTAVKCPTVKHHWRSKVPWSNVTCGQVFLILVASQKCRGQMSLAVICPAVKCHLRSNVSRSNVTCGQMSRSQMSLWSNVPWSNVSRSNETVVIGDPIRNCLIDGQTNPKVFAN